MILSLVTLNIHPLYRLFSGGGLLAAILVNIVAYGDDKGSIHEGQHFFGDDRLRNVYKSWMEACIIIDFVRLNFAF